MQEEYIVTLWRHEDLGDFYDDMETEGGSLYIPDRAVGLQAQRPTSRNTHYMLTPEEANTLRSDDRVRGVTRTQGVEIRPHAFTTSGVYDKSDFAAPNGTDSRNWNLYRSRNLLTDDANQLSWTSSGSLNEELSESITFTETGRNVDIVVCDGHVDPAHPEMQLNADGTGGTRVIQEDWSQYNATVQGMNPSLGTSSAYFFTNGYTYAPYTSNIVEDFQQNQQHGASVACISAGNRQGYAPSANVYNICCYSSTQLTLGNVTSTVAFTLFDYIRAWHNAKSINADTGCKNPTIVNCSFGYINILATDGNTWPYYAETPSSAYGDANNTANKLTNQEMEDAKIFASSDITNNYNGSGDRRAIISYDFVPAASDVEDAIADGIHFVVSAGNDNTLAKSSTNPEKSQYFFRSVQDGQVEHHSKGFCGDAGINVGCVSGIATSTGEEPVFYTNRGEGVDIYAYGDGCTAGLNADATFMGSVISDDRNSSYYMNQFNGTSCAAPQVTGMLAGILERYPDYTPAQAKADLLSRAIGETFDGTGDWPTGNQYEANETPKVAFKRDEIRPESGVIDTRSYRGVRGTSGAVYPRKAANTYRTRT